MICLRPHRLRPLLALLALGLVATTTGCIPDLAVDAPEPPSMCDPEGLAPLADAFPPCDLGACGETEADRERGRCVDTNQVPEAQRDLLAPCGTGDALCVPVDVLVTGGRHAPQTCRSVAGLEGRCTSECVPAVREQLDLLPVDVCSEGERCAPCYDPTTGSTTGACETSHCDAPSEPKPNFCEFDFAANPLLDPSSFPSCPAEACGEPDAHCLPNAYVPADQADLLADCDEHSKCVPDAIMISGGLTPAPGCRAFRDQAEGRCLSLCIPDIAEQAELLAQETCAGGERCAPCYDPLTGEPTGACEGECDVPAEEPFVFPSCCEDQGPDLAVCIPDSSIPEDKRGSLSQDSCAQGDLCVPREFTEPGFAPPSCTYGLVQEGACISVCVDDQGIGEENDPDCPANTRCVPCSLVIASTGACDF